MLFITILIITIVTFLYFKKEKIQSKSTQNKTSGLISKASPNNFLWSQDFLKNNSIVAFYNMKEAVNAYKNTHSIEGRRNIALEVESVINTFINYDFSDDEIDFLIMLSKKNEDLIKSITPDSNLFNLLRNADKRGLKLLNVTGDISLSTLKKCYRNASLKYHPDKGGSHEEMIRVNDAYTKFYDIIENHKSLEKIVKTISSPVQWNDWMFSCLLIKACINADFFAADKIIKPLEKAYNYATKSNSNYAGYFSYELGGFEGDVLSKLSYTLHRFSMYDEWSKSREITHFFYEQIIKGKIKNEYGDLLTRGFFTELMIKKYSKEEFEKNIPKLVIRHIEQGENAYRLKKIDDKRIKSIRKRYDKRKSEDKVYFDDLIEFCKNFEFQVEVNDYDYKSDIIQGSIIRDVSLEQKRYHHLSAQQKWEFLKSFKDGHDGKLIDKYLKIRSQDIMLGLINRFEKLDIKNLTRECEFFSKIEECTEHSSYENVLEFIIYLESIRKNERKEICKILSSLDNQEIEEQVLIINIGLNQSNDSEYIVSTSYDYLKFAKSGLNDIVSYRNSGRLPEEQHLDWNEALKKIEELDNSKIGEKYNNVWLNVKNASPDLVIESSKPYAEKLLEIGKKINLKYTGEIQIGYVINRLTIAYAKKKKWDEVITWGELFFNLPMHYRDRSTESEKEVIRKRILRAHNQKNN